MKKNLVIWLISLFVPINALAQKGALYSPPAAFNVMDVVGWIGVIVGWIVGPGELPVFEGVFVRLMLLTLLVIVLYRAAKKISFFGGDNEEKTTIPFLVALIVSIIAVRLFTENVLKAIFLPYGALGVAVSIGIPFLLLFALLNLGGIPRPMRKLGWLLFAVSMFGLWWIRYNQIYDIAYYYLGFAVLGFILLLFDGTIIRWVRSARLGRVRARAVEEQVALLEEKLGDVYALYAEAKTPAARKVRAGQIRSIEKRIHDLHKNL